MEMKLEKASNESLIKLADLMYQVADQQQVKRTLDVKELLLSLKNVGFISQQVHDETIGQLEAFRTKQHA
jgi:hypothetical protein